ncbi:MAG: macro domain-containing protein [Candidatus Methanoperedens sp.]|nr:macro domain-containing protein [Candidatus Methanoperedens sp.]
MEAKIGTTRITLVLGDITEQETDAIVNAANPTLMGGGGVDGAIHRKGGAEILKECKLIRQTLYPEGLPTGKAVATSGGKLKAKKVIHTVGPIWSGGNNREHELLAEAYRTALVEKASSLAISSVLDFLGKNKGIVEVRFVLHSQHDMRTYKDALKEIQDSLI